MMQRLFHPWLVVRIQFLLGAVFLVAAWPKLLDPPGFAKAVANQRARARRLTRSPEVTDKEHSPSRGCTPCPDASQASR